MYFLPGGGRNGAGFTARFRRWRSLWTASDAVCFAIAAILFTAAVLKTHQLATEPPLGTGLLESRWFLIGVVQFEILLGFWLALSPTFRFARWGAATAFSLRSLLSVVQHGFFPAFSESDRAATASFEDIRFVPSVHWPRARTPLFCWTTLWIGISLSPLVMGCTRRESQSLSADPPSIDQNLVHDVGTLVSGQVVSHKFVFVNRTDETIALADDKVKRTCTCSALKVAKTRLAPGEQTEVAVSVDTRGRIGRLYAGGESVWIGDSGLLRPKAAFFLEGLIESAVRCEPPFVEFDEEDVRRGVKKEIIVTSPLKVAWNLTRVSSDSPSFNVEQASPSFDRVCVFVSCKPDRGLPEAIGSLDIEAPVVDSNSARAIPTVTATLPLRGRQRVPFFVTPRQALVSFGSEGRRATLQFLIRHSHEYAARPLVLDVRSAGLCVSWRLAATCRADVSILHIALALEGTERPKGVHRLIIQPNGLVPEDVALILTP